MTVSLHTNVHVLTIRFILSIRIAITSTYIRMQHVLMYGVRKMHMYVVNEYVFQTNITKLLHMIKYLDQYG